MNFSQKFGSFLLFLLLTIVTVGIYPLWFYVVRQEEINELLKQIRHADLFSIAEKQEETNDLLRQIRDKLRRKKTP